MLQELKQFWLVAQAAYARWGYLKNRNSSLLLCHLTLLSFPFAACQNLVLNPGVSSPLEHISVARWLTNLLWCTFSPVQIPQFKGWSEKQETKHNSSYKSSLPERIHSSTGSAGPAVESINKTEVDRYSSYLKWSGFKQEIALFPEMLSEIKLPSDIHPAAKKKSDEDIKLQVKANIAIYSQLWNSICVAFEYLQKCSKGLQMQFKSKNKKDLQTPAEMLESAGGHNWTSKCALLVLFFLRNNDWILYMVKSNHVTLIVKGMHGQPEKKYQAPPFFCNCSNFRLKRL